MTRTQAMGLAEDAGRVCASLNSRDRNAGTLTKGEAAVLELVGLGLSNREIGQMLFISHDTVRTHVKRIHDKCAVEGRARLAVAAYRAMVLKEGE